MGNISSTTSALSTHPTTHSTSTFSEAHRSFTVAPFGYSTFVSITKATSKSSSYGPSLTRTGEHCSWDWEADTSSCSSWSFTVEVPTPFTLPTPTGAYGTPGTLGTPTAGTTSISFPDYTCTDFLCVDSVVSKYGYSLCYPTPTPFGLPTETMTWPEESSTDVWPTVTPTCDPELDWYCPGPISELSKSLSDTRQLTIEEPTPSWETISWPTETSSDCETPLIFTTPKSLSTASATTTTKDSYSYHGGSTRRTSTSTTSECDFWVDCTLEETAKQHTTLEWDTDPWIDHTVSVTVSSPRRTAEAKE